VVVLDSPSSGEHGSASEEAFIFVSDASAEAERLTASLRSRGYLVADVPLGLLVGRVGAQRPAIVLCDADAPSAIEVVERMREVPGGDAINVLFFGETGGVMDAQHERLSRQASALFVRPVDVYALLRKIESLIGRPVRRSSRPSALQLSSRAPVLVAATRRPYRYDTRARANPSQRPPAEHKAPPSLLPPRGGVEPPLAAAPRQTDVAVPPLTDAARLSTELARLLGRAEERVSASQAPPPLGERLSPEAEIDAVLPPDLLAALDEPLDDLDDDDDDLRTPGSQSSEGSAPSRASRSESDSTAGTAPGGSSHRFSAPETTSGGRTAEPPDPDPVDPAPVTPPARPRGPASTTGTDMTGTAMSASFPLSGPAQPPPSVPREEPPTGPATPRQITTRPPHLAREPVEMAVPAAPQPWVTIDIPHSLGKGDVARVLARAVRARYSGAIAFEDTTGIRRVVFRDGDFVTAAAGIDGESLVAFLGQRGDLQPDAVQRLGRKLPQFGRHAGAALIAQGHLRQDDLWPVLRGHAEWLLTRLVLLESGAASLEHDVPPRLSAEPSVFGGATGAEVFIEVLRRAVPPDRAIAWLGGPGARFAAGDLGPLLAETALPDDDLRIVMSASGATLDELLERAPGPDIAAVLFGLVELGVLKLRTSAAPARPVQRAVDPLDHDALRARVRARRALVDEGDYFALLGVERSATGYDIRRAYTDLRRELDPSRVLTPATADLSEDVELILEVLDEAYEVLRDQVRRERYRRALEQEP